MAKNSWNLIHLQQKGGGEKREEAAFEYDSTVRLGSLKKKAVIEILRPR